MYSRLCKTAQVSHYSISRSLQELQIESRKGFNLRLKKRNQHKIVDYEVNDPRHNNKDSHKSGLQKARIQATKFSVHFYFLSIHSVIQALGCSKLKWIDDKPLDTDKEAGNKATSFTTQTLNPKPKLRTTYELLHYHDFPC